ncbi:hypothetical protein M407DRAFT_95073 [Tulasnella calospora MUT 4182]|uniref:Uncharacterized protein n=1 Tax=Tulasnella calospora MUT 4182 TaxID=1051891 RepID=A0A0C3QFR1_9AGAM|nr:hypothetical protein M407DRAFT_95073 [Tulasnella calospora MUT 4182]
MRHALRTQRLNRMSRQSLSIDPASNPLPRARLPARMGFTQFTPILACGNVGRAPLARALKITGGGYQTITIWPQPKTLLEDYLGNAIIHDRMLRPATYLLLNPSGPSDLFSNQVKIRETTGVEFQNAARNKGLPLSLRSAEPSLSSFKFKFITRAAATRTAAK